MQIEPKIKNYINAQLRRIFKWSNAYKLCKLRAHIKGTIYRCDGCAKLVEKDPKGFLTTHINGEDVIIEKLYVDHISPVVPTTGYIDMNDWAEYIIKRTFPSVDGLQYLCHTCHYIKTQIENQERRDSKNRSKL